MIEELVIISGKGGTGKTSLAASFAVLAERAVIADCDVDAADLHLILCPQVKERHEFKAGYQAVIRAEDCIGCGACQAQCRFAAVRAVAKNGDAAETRLHCLTCSSCRRSCSMRIAAEIQEMEGAMGVTRPEKYAVDPLACEGCGVCVLCCPVQAIDMHERVCGEWMVSNTRCGPMVHARLGIAAENSGKLVSVVRQEARRAAEAAGRSLVIVDGPPGIGCPVIASLSGASLALIVTEPTVSGEHDLERVLSLTRHFGVPAAVCVNKWDINPAVSERIESRVRSAGGAVAGRIRYDSAVTAAQLAERTVVETPAPSGADIRQIWESMISHRLR